MSRLRTLTLLVVALTTACAEDDEIIFCDTTTSCSEPPVQWPVVCGTRVCPQTKCNIGWTCSVDNDCISLGDLPGFNDHDKCTEDKCENDTGEITHRRITPEELDDGDLCTEDGCAWYSGPEHNYMCSATCADPDHC